MGCDLAEYRGALRKLLCGFPALFIHPPEAGLKSFAPFRCGGSSLILGSSAVKYGRYTKLVYP
jgi:hypothetical protein